MLTANEALAPNRILVIGYPSHLGKLRTRIGLAKWWQIAAGAVLEKSGPAQAKGRSIYLG
jgi:hypothetical protein